LSEDDLCFALLPAARELSREAQHQDEDGDKQSTTDGTTCNNDVLLLASLSLHEFFEFLHEVLILLLPLDQF